MDLKIPRSLRISAVLTESIHKVFEIKIIALKVAFEVSGAALLFRILKDVILSGWNIY